MIALYDPANTNRAYFGTDTRAAAILFGAALAAALADSARSTRRSARVALEALGDRGRRRPRDRVDPARRQSSTLYRGGFLLCGLAATAIIAAAVHPERGPIAHALSWRPLCALGLISYGVYLYHWPIDVVLDAQRVHLGGWPLFAVQTVVTLAVAIVSYRFIEQPIRHGAIQRVAVAHADSGRRGRAVGHRRGRHHVVGRVPSQRRRPLPSRRRAPRLRESDARIDARRSSSAIRSGTTSRETAFT